MPRTLVAALILVAVAAAAKDVPLISGNAVGPLRIGMSATAVSKVAKVTSDRFEPGSEGGQVRVVRVVIAGTEVAAEVHKGRVWRIEVAQPGLRTSEGFGAGSSLSDLLKLRPLEVQVGGGALYVWSTQLCGASFRLSHELQTDKDYLTNWNASALATLPPTVTVRSLLVTGCTK